MEIIDNTRYAMYTRVARFFLVCMYVQHTKTGKIYQMVMKYIPNVEKIDRMAKNVSSSSIARPSIFFQIGIFWFENIPSGNPDIHYVCTYALV
jgi:hypothetical protein